MRQDRMVGEVPTPYRTELVWSSGKVRLVKTALDCSVVGVTVDNSVASRKTRSAKVRARVANATVYRCMPATAMDAGMPATAAVRMAVLRLAFLGAQES